MATGQSLWVGASDDLVLDAQGARVASAAYMATNSSDPLDVRLGLVYSGDSQLLVGTAGLSVNVDPHHFVGSKGSANGPYIGVNKTTTAVTVPAAPALGNKRIDVIWVVQTDKHATVSADASTAIVYGYTTGSATSGVPSKPAISGAPGGAVEVGTVTWDSTSTVATATTAAQCTLATTGPWTTTKGAPIPCRSSAERDALTAYAGMRVLRLDRSIVEIYDGSGWRGSVKTYSPVWAADTTNPTIGSGGGVTGYYVEDGEFVDFVIKCLLGTSGASSGSGPYSLSLPVSASLTEPFSIVGTALYTTGGTNYALIPQFLDATHVRLMIDGNANVWGPTLPATINVGASVRLQGRYRRA